MKTSRHIPTNLENRPFDPLILTDDESCFVMANVTRVALIKLLGSFSRDAYVDRSLTEQEIDALGALYYTVQT